MAPRMRHDGVMDLRPYVDNLRDQLMAAADVGGKEASELVERLVAPIESAIRLTLLNALSSAAEEITRDLAPGSVDMRLRGLEPSFVVTAPVDLSSFDDDAVAGFEDAMQGMGSFSMAGWVSALSTEDEGVTARINFRPPEQLKARIEEAASREGMSVNAWLVRAVTAVLERTGGGGSERRQQQPQNGGPAKNGQRQTGWVR